MNLTSLAVLYVCVSVGTAVFVLVRHGTERAAARDAMLVFLFWPLYGPFVLTRERGQRATAAAKDLCLVETFRLARRSSFGELLPNDATIHRLASRIVEVTGRLGEIDRVLADPTLAARAESDRQSAFESSGHDRAAQIVAIRREQMDRLRALRDRFAREITEIRELLVQLRLQAELLRWSDDPGANTRDLVTEIVCRVEGLVSVTGFDLTPNQGADDAASDANRTA